MCFGKRIAICFSFTTCLLITGCSYNYIYRLNKETSFNYLNDPINEVDTLSVLVEVPFTSHDKKKIQIFIQTKIPERSKLLGFIVELKSSSNSFKQESVALEWSLPPVGKSLSLFDTTVVKSSFDKLPDDLKYSHLTSSIKSDPRSHNYTIIKYLFSSSKPINESELTLVYKIQFKKNDELISHERETRLYLHKQRQRQRIG